jgi:hypothetical protein
MNISFQVGLPVSINTLSTLSQEPLLTICRDDMFILLRFSYCPHILKPYNCGSIHHSSNIIIMFAIFYLHGIVLDYFSHRSDSLIMLSQSLLSQLMKVSEVLMCLILLTRTCTSLVVVLFLYFVSHIFFLRLRAGRINLLMTSSLIFSSKGKEEMLSSIPIFHCSFYQKLPHE